MFEVVVTEKSSFSSKLSACSRIATILTSDKSTDGVSRLLSKADLERLKLDKAKPLAKMAECLGFQFIW